MTSCIKTGAHCYLADYGLWVYGDAFRVGDAFILNIAGEPSWGAPPAAHYTLQSNPIQLCFVDGRGDSSAQAVKRGSVLVVPWVQVRDHGYDGINTREYRDWTWPRDRTDSGNFLNEPDL